MTNFNKLFSRTQRFTIKKTIGERIAMAQNAYKAKAYIAADYDCTIAYNTIRFLWTNDFYSDKEYFALDKILFDLKCKIKHKIKEGQ